MEQHPVPQNVTTFQFRLVGDMTIKQFGYLAGGIILGYISYKLPLPFFFTWPLAITSGLLGFGLAFVPVEERPMDVWIASFFKNVYSPTQWVWQKEKRVREEPTTQKPAVAPPAAKQLHAARQSLLTQTVNALSAFFASIIPAVKPKHAAPRPPTAPTPHAVQKTQPTPTGTPRPVLPSGSVLSINHAASFFDRLKSIFQNKSKPPAPSLSPGFSFSDALTKHAGPPKKPRVPIPPPPPAPPQPVVAPPVPPAVHTPVQAPAHGRVVELQGQLSEALGQRERLEKELAAMRQQMANQAKSASQPPMRQASVVPSTPMSTTSVRVIAPGAASKAGLPRLTTFPNVVTGIIKDHYGNLLAGMLITVRGKDDVPLRALKTNRLGQFAASTPLPDNTYIVEIEDPKGGFTFDKIQISLRGTVAPPIEVTAKSQKQVERDKLAKEIFGNQPM